MSGLSPPAGPMVLALNVGSSSVRFSLYRLGAALDRTLHGQCERLGSGDAVFEWLAEQVPLNTVSAVGHRLVHGMAHSEPERVTPKLIDELRSFAWIDPDHLPDEIDLIDAVRRHSPALPQVVCFDTAFHSRMPTVARLLALPRRLQAQGVRRYGFHGLSYAYLVEELARVAGTPAAQARVILAHLGNGASLAAVRGGQGIDTSMGFTPASGLPMGTRSGDADPGLAPFLARTEGMTPGQFDHMVNHESGLLGVSETSADMRKLLERESTDARAAEAVALFCYHAKKGIGAYAAALGGLDTLVFAGGIGENAAPVRARVCEGLGFLGIELDDARNATHAALISSAASAVAVRVIRTDEELMIARSACRVVGLVA